MRAARRVLLLLLAASLAPPAAAIERPPGLGDVVDVRHWSYPAYTRVVIELSRPVETTVQPLPPDPRTGAPARLFFDLPGIWVGRSREAPVPIGDGLLRRVRLGQNTLDTTRVVLDLENAERHRVLRLADPERVVVDVYGPREARAGGGRPLLPGELRPVQRIVVDPGHGGRDPGAIGHGRLREKDVTLRLARALRRELVALGFEVVLTRDDDRTLSLLERTAIAEGVGGDVFISIHANAAPNRRAEGVEIYTLDENAERQTLRLAARENDVAPGQVDPLQRLLTTLRVSEVSQRSDLLADLVHERIVRSMGRRWPSVRGPGRRRGPFYVLYLSDMPSILVETGFVTHKGDARRLRDPDYLERMAAAIAEGVAAFRDRSGPLVAERPR